MEDVQPEICMGGNFTFECHMYERYEMDTQVLVLTEHENEHITNNDDEGVGGERKGEGYIAMVYAVTDDFRDIITDTDMVTKPTKSLDTKFAEKNGALFHVSSFEKLNDDDHGGDPDGDDEVPPIPRADLFEDDDDDVWSPDYELSMEQHVGIINLFADNILN